MLLCIYVSISHFCIISYKTFPMLILSYPEDNMTRVKLAPHLLKKLIFYSSIVCTFMHTLNFRLHTSSKKVMKK